MASVLFEELQRSWLTSLIGIAVFLGGICLLTWNEGRAVHHHHSLEEAYSNAIVLNPFEKIQPEYDERVVHITGELVVDEPLTEPTYGIAVQAVKLKRRVQMYQWIEERAPRNDNDDIVQEKTENDYYYVTEWRDKLVDSSSFYIRHGHENPQEIPLKTVTYLALYVRVGALGLNNEIKEKFMDFTEVSSDTRPERRDIKLHLGIYYHCRDIYNPEVGDIRVQFYYAGLAGEEVTIVAKQKNGELVPYRSSRDRDIILLRYGNLNLNQMFTAEHSDARVETWKFRFYGCALIYFATICLSRILKILFSRVPYLNDLISGDPLDTKNFLLAGSTALFIVAFAWMAYRPIIGATLILAAASPMVYCIVGVYSAAQSGLGLRS